MKNIFTLLLLLIPSVSFCQHTPRLWDFSVKVYDQKMKPLQDVEYIITYYEEIDGKWGKQRFVGITDVSGSFTFKKKSLHMLSLSFRK
jgi:hypothetical protein